MKKKLVYLATPYSNPDHAVRQKRFEKVNKVAADLIIKGEMVFSPISHTHPIAAIKDLPKDWAYWESFCRTYLECCYKIYVLMIDGWEESIGVTAEIKIAKELGLEIEYIEYEK